MVKTITLLAGQVSEIESIAPGTRITSSGNGSIEWVAGSLSDAKNSATWTAWAKGSAAGYMDSSRQMCIRATATGSMTVTIAEGEADRVGVDAYWEEDVPVLATDANGNTVLVGADGEAIPLIRVYTTTLTLSADTGALVSGTIIPLDLALIDDLGMADATVIGRINIPSYIKKIRVTARASYKYDAAYAGTYRSCVVTASPATNAPVIKAQPFPSVGTSTMAPAATAFTGLIDVAGLGWDISAGTAYIQMTTNHDGNAAPPILPAASKSFLTVEMYV